MPDYIMPAEANQIRVSLKCPYCGRENVVYLEPYKANRLFTCYCNLDSGGCDKPFAYRVAFVPQVEYYKLEAV